MREEVVGLDPGVIEPCGCVMNVVVLDRSVVVHGVVEACVPGVILYFFEDEGEEPVLGKAYVGVFLAEEAVVDVHIVEKRVDVNKRVAEDVGVGSAVVIEWKKEAHRMEADQVPWLKLASVDIVDVFGGHGSKLPCDF